MKLTNKKFRLRIRKSFLKPKYIIQLWSNFSCEAEKLHPMKPYAFKNKLKKIRKYKENKR